MTGSSHSPDALDSLSGFAAEWRAWRRDFHRYPELAFKEQRTSALIAERLRQFGFEVTEGLGGTGVVGCLQKGCSPRAIALRADMDALPIDELSDLEYRSVHPGRMHACGHDGHMAMLLGAAQLLSREVDFDGRVVLIFQPAEESGGGAEVMINDGLWGRFPVNRVYAIHNMPHLPAGVFGLRSGAIMASRDIFEINIIGRGAHGAMPQEGIDPIVLGAQLVGALQGIVARNIDPLSSAVISVTQFHAGDSDNVIPASATLRGGVRSFDAGVRSIVEQRIRDLVAGFCTAHCAHGVVHYHHGYPTTVNDDTAAQIAARAAAHVVGESGVDAAVSPMMASEDFAYMLRSVPGAYVFLGSGRKDPVISTSLHNPTYDFNDDVLPLGVKFWLSLVECELGVSPAGAFVS